MDVNSISSLTRFSVGGAAIFEQVKINHHSVSDGMSAKNPLFKIILRDLDDLYNMLAIANKADEERPCAIIIAIAPFHPQVFLLIKPAIIRPM